MFFEKFVLMGIVFIYLDVFVFVIIKFCLEWIKIFLSLYNIVYIILYLDRRLMF